MSFEHPWMLLGCLGAAIPIIIHLSHRRWAREIEFAAIDFLLLSDRKVARRFRVRQLLVLLLRVLLIAAVPFALAKPYSASEAPLPIAAATPTSVVIVVDDSASMNYAAAGETLLERARERALTIVDELPPSHNVAIVTAARPARVAAGPLTFDRAQTRAALKRMVASERGTDVYGALRAAEQLLAESKLPRRQVVLLTDCTVGGWPNSARLDVPWVTPHPPALHVIDVTEGLSLPNVGIVDARLVRANGPGEAASELHVTVRNETDAEWHELLTVELGPKTVKGYLKVEPRGEATKVFRVDSGNGGPGGGGVASYGSVSIPEDALPLDDLRWFAAEREERMRVVVINGSPRSVPHQDETFFLDRALRLGREAAGGVEAVTMRLEELSAAQLETTDAVVLANVGELGAEQATALLGFVRRGGGLLVAAGDNLTEKSAATYGELLPLPVRGVRRGGPALGGDGSTRLAPPRRRHPLFEPFVLADGRADPESSLFRARVWRHLLLSSEARGEVLTLLSFTDGAPALVERQIGRGRVALLATTIDRDWTDLPIRTSFLPLVRQLVRHLGQQREERARANALVGERVGVPAPRLAERVLLTRPDGRRDEYPLTVSEDAASALLDALDSAGLYRVEVHVGGTDAHVEHRVLAVGPDSRELLFERLAVERISESLRVPGAGYAPGADLPEEGRAPDARTRYWSTILLALFGLLLMETWLVVRG